MAMRAASALASVLATAAALPAAPGKVTVHVVPHTHDDVGWLKTVDEYYNGQNNSIQHANVHMVIDTVVDELQKNPDRTFTYVEQAFFQRWWRQQDERTRKITQDLVKRGQLSFTNGGWCMHDEAAPFYLDMIDQTTLGHKFLMDEFGFAPKTGWQLDPFGHSSTQAALLSAEVGFTGLFFGRIDYQDLALRRDPEHKKAEFVWRASPSLGEGAQVFSGLTGSYGGNYGPPDGFDWDDHNSNDETMQDDPELTNYNVKTRVDQFVAQALLQANRTRGTNIMFTMGSDFQWENSHEWYYNLDRIIKYVNLDGRINAMYSTPEMYVDAKAKEATIAWPLKTDDFFPYADGPHKFWTGYFTSRPALKRYIRDSSSFLQVVRQLGAFGFGAESLKDEGIVKFSEALGVAQHHDAVAGTAKQHVTFDYAMRIANGRQKSLLGASSALAKLSDARAGAKVGFEFCILRNESVCGPTQVATKDMDFVLYNGLAQSRSEVVELPVAGHVRVMDSDGNEVNSQIVPSPPTLTNYGENSGGSPQTLLFKADVPAMGFKAYRFVSTKGTIAAAFVATTTPSTTLENEFVALEFCDNTLCKITNKESGISIKAEQSWLWYEGSVGNAVSGQASGAYIFRPNNNTATPVFAGTPTLQLVRGALADEVHQTFGTWVSQRIRLEKGARHAEITYTVGPIPVGDGLGKEVISRFTTDIASAGECFTDSNGREMIPRKRDYRETWKLDQTEPVAGNYFPITSSIFIRDKKSQLTLLTDAAQAGSGCVRDGELEMMVHRACLKDDGRGVSEPLNETEFITPYVGDNQGQHYGRGLVIRGKHLLAVGAPAEAAKMWRPLQDQLYMPLMPFFATNSAKLAKPSFSALAQALPANVQIVSLQQWDEQTVMLRLAHQFGLGEHETLSKPATVDLEGLFAGKRILQADERGLAVTVSREEVLKRRIPWKVEGEAKPAQSEDAPKGSLEVTLGPLQIRTFLIKLGDAPSESFI